MSTFEPLSAPLAFLSQGHDDPTPATESPPLQRLPPRSREALGAYARDGSVVHTLYEDGQVRVVSDENIATAKAQQLARRIEEAYAFDRAQQRWDRTGPLDAPLTVAVLSQGAFTAFTGDTTGSVAGVTTGPNLFVVPDSVLKRRTAQDENTIAHELAHVQDLREGGRGIGSVPIYIQEGKAYVLGERYPLHEHLRNPHLEYVAQALSGVTAAKAREVLGNFRKAEDENGNPDGFFGETLGALFVEFLRTRLSGKGVPDAVPQLAQTVEAVGEGADFSRGFQERFGVSLADAENQFLAYLRQTEGKPDERFQGTVFQLAGAGSKG